MEKSIKIGSLWIELSEDNHLDTNQSEASTLRDEQVEQQPPQPTLENSNNNIVVNSEADAMMISDNDKSIEDKPKKIRLLADIFKELDSKETICHYKKRVARISSHTTKKKISQSRISKLHVEENNRKNKNKIPIIKVEGKMKTSNNHEDDNELSVLEKGKGRMDEINDDSDSSTSWNEEKLSKASHSELFPRDPLLFGEGASKFFEEETSNNIKDNSVPTCTIEDYGIIDDDDVDIIMDEDDEIFGYNSMCFDDEIDEEELKRNPKKRKWGKD